MIPSRNLLLTALFFGSMALIMALQIGCAAMNQPHNTCMLEVERAMDILPKSTWKRVLIFQVRGARVEHYVVAYDVPRAGNFRIWDNDGGVVLPGVTRGHEPLYIARNYWHRIGLNPTEIVSARWEDEKTTF